MQINTQPTFSSLEESTKKVITKKAKFLAEMEKAVPWKQIIKKIKPYYFKSNAIKGGRPQYPIEIILRIYFLQNWYNLSDPAAEEFLYDIPEARNFCQTNLANIPDETTIMNFRHLVEKYNLSEKIFKEVNKYLVKNGIVVSKGTIVDATIINAPKSIRNKDKKRDPKMSSTRKNNNYHFGAKIHIGTDSKTNVIHSARFTTAKNADVNEMYNLMHGDEEALIADAGYSGDKHRKRLRASGIAPMIVHKKRPSHTKTKRVGLSSTQKKNNSKSSRTRSKVEHIFRVIKCQFGYVKTRYKGLYKNEVQMFSLLALTNIYTQRKKLMQLS